MFASPFRLARKMAQRLSEYEIEEQKIKAAAKALKEEFTPKEGVDYRWVVEFARRRHEYFEKSAESLDNKAASIIGYLGGGTGLFTLGSVAAIGSGNANPWIVLLAFPSVLLAGLALYFASKVRRTSSYGYPKLESAVEYAEHFQPPIEDPDQKPTRSGEEEFIGTWHEATELTKCSLARKGRDFDWAMRLFFWAIIALFLPLTAGAVTGFLKQPPSKPVVEFKLTM